MESRSTDQDFMAVNPLVMASVKGIVEITFAYVY